jgi:hypothetical protein
MKYPAEDNSMIDKKKQEIITSNYMYLLNSDNPDLNDLDNSDPSKNKQMANLLHTTINPNIDSEELKTYVLKCMTPIEMRNQLLKFELKHYNPEPKEMSLDEFAMCAQTILDRYQNKAGGFMFEDKLWKLHTPKSKKYSLLSNELIFENTTSDSKEAANMKKNSFFVQIKNILNKLTLNIRVTHKVIYSYRDDIYWVVLKCKKTQTNDATNTSANSNNIVDEEEIVISL